MSNIILAIVLPVVLFLLVMSQLFAYNRKHRKA